MRHSCRAESEGENPVLIFKNLELLKATKVYTGSSPLRGKDDGRAQAKDARFEVVIKLLRIIMYSEKFSSVYILCSKRNGTLYIGVTKNLPKRIYEHKSKLADSFTKKHNIDKLVYYECFDLIIDAIKREKILKHYKREAKLELIESFNPSWKDLYHEIIC